MMNGHLDEQECTKVGYMVMYPTLTKQNLYKWQWTYLPGIIVLFFKRFAMTKFQDFPPNEMLLNTAKDLQKSRFFDEFGIQRSQHVDLRFLW